MSVELVSIDGSEPITIQEAKDQCYITGSNWDEYLDTLITVTREYAENETWRAIIDATYKYHLDEFPDEIKLPKPPVRSVEKIEYVDTDGNTQTLSGSKYDADTDGQFARIQPAYGETWPDTREVYNAVTVTFKAGYDGSSDKYTLPKQIKQAMLLMIKHLFENRQSVEIGQAGVIDAKEVPMTTNLLLGFHSARRYV